MNKREQDRLIKELVPLVTRAFQAVGRAFQAIPSKYRMVMVLVGFLVLLLVLLLVLFLRVNLSAFLLGLALFSALAFALDPAFHQVGLALLTLPALNGMWTALYNSTLWRLERFNNSIVMGSLVVSLALFVPMVLIGNRLVVKYREHVLQWVMRTRLMKAFQASKLFGYYQSVSGWGQ